MMRLRKSGLRSFSFRAILFLLFGTLVANVLSLAVSVNVTFFRGQIAEAQTAVKAMMFRRLFAVNGAGMIEWSSDRPAISVKRFASRTFVYSTSSTHGFLQMHWFTR